MTQHIHYFCGNTEIPEDLQAHETQRAALYKATAGLVRAFANIADELEAAGYSEADIVRIKWDIDSYLKLREIIRKASGETVDLKAYEADMRHLIDTYIEADEPRKISPFDNMTLLQLIVKTGIAEAINSMPGGIKGNKRAIAETIENNVRSKIIKDQLNDPAFYNNMSALLDEIIAARKAKAIDYEEYLKRIAELAKRVEAGQAENTFLFPARPGTDPQKQGGVIQFHSRHRVFLNHLEEVTFSPNIMAFAIEILALRFLHGTRLWDPLRFTRAYESLSGASVPKKHASWFGYEGVLSGMVSALLEGHKLSLLAGGCG